MRLPERFVLTIEGKLWDAHRRASIVPNALPHLLTELLTGSHCHEAAAALAAFGLRVTIEIGTDQGDDGLDELSVPTRKPKPTPVRLGPAGNQPIRNAGPEPRYWPDEDSPLPPEPVPRRSP